MYRAFRIMNESLRGGKKETVTPAQWRQVKVMFEEALALEPAARNKFLASSEIDGQPVDEQIRAEVFQMLLVSVQAVDFLEAPLSLHSSAIRNFDRSLNAMGRRIGPYRIVQMIGRGGMSVVYLAERADDIFDRRVAVKLVWPEIITREIERRFTQERRILAKLNHLNIAQLLDGGVDEDGCPYVVMEYIEGDPITAYCDAHKLSIVDRLKIFQQVCAAVQYAHNNLIVHRDLKPGNILVSSDGTVKLLDFGIAKLLDPLSIGIKDSYSTQQGVSAMTPEYASPEQARGENVTISSDLYSLGVIFYELISGHRPYQINSRTQMEAAEAINQATPAPPSQIIERVLETIGSRGEKIVTHSPKIISETREQKPERLRAALKGDLDAIALKALQKEPDLRYHSASAFSEDINRHLTGQPVTAKQESWGDYAKRLWRVDRGRIFLAALTVLIGAVVAGVLIWEAQKTKAQAAAQLQLLRRLYAADMRQAGDDWMDKNITQAKALVERYQRRVDDQTEQDLRGFEWYFLYNALNPIDPKFQLQGSANELVVSADGKQVYIGTVKGKIEVLDASRDRIAGVFADLGEKVRAMAISQDGQYLAAATKGKLKVWERSSGKVIFETMLESDLRCLALSPDGSLIASGGDDAMVRVWKSGAAEPVAQLKYDGKWVRSLQFSKDGKTLAVGGTGDLTIDLWDARTFQRAGKLKGSGSDFLHLNYSPDGKFLAAATRDGIIRMWNLETGSIQQTYTGHQGMVWSVAFSPDGSILASAGQDRTIRYWDAPSGDVLANLRSEYEIDTLVFSPDPETPVVYYTSGDSVYRDFMQRDESPYVIPDLLSSDITSVATSPDNTAVAAVTTTGSILLWDERSRKTRAIIENPQLSFQNIDYSPDGKQLVISGGSGRDAVVQLRDAVDGSLIKSMEGPIGYVYTAAFSPDQKFLAAGGEDHQITLWDATSGKIIRILKGHRDAVRSLLFFPGGGRLLSRGLDEQFFIWDLNTGAQVFYQPSIAAAALSPDGFRLALCNNKYLVTFWDVRLGRPGQSLQGHGGALRALAFSPDGGRLATTGEDNAIRLWDVESGLPVLTLGRFKAQISSLAFSKDGRMLVSGGKDRRIRLWRSPF